MELTHSHCSYVFKNIPRSCILSRKKSMNCLREMLESQGGEKKTANISILTFEAGWPSVYFELK